jgi:GGDEF domain-containing protein
MSEVSRSNHDAITLPHPNFVWLGKHKQQPWHPWFENFSSTEEVIAAGIQPQLVVISMQAEEQDAYLLSLRRAPLTSHCVILVEHESALSPFLANGPLTPDYKEKLQAYQLRLEQMKLEYQDDNACKLLAYLWLHDTKLIPHAIPSKPHLYQYPLLKAWGLLPEESFSWLNEVKQNGWLDTAKLHNRVRFCPSCHSGHLNYIDVCPQCQSIDTESRSSLHCFSCGHVGDQSSFRKLTTLSCPNCLTQLRHIGVDYDRPIENQHCNSCSTLYTDALVHAECLHCHVKSQLSDLHVRNIYSFKLAPQGKNIVRKGRAQSLFTLTPGEQMPIAQFYWLLDWQNKLARRHGQTHTLLSIQILNLNQFLASEGDAKGFAQLEALQERLRNVIRITDSCSNYSRDGLLMLLPMTAPEQIQHVTRKLLEMKGKQVSAALELNIKAISLPAEMGANIADWLTDALTKALPLK